MRLPLPGRPLSLAVNQWFVLAFAVFIAGPAVLFLTFTPEINAFLAREVLIPRLERELGFRMGSAVGRDPCGGNYEMPAFTYVASNSPLAKAGVNAGDVPFMYHGLPELAGELNAVGARDARIRVASGSSFQAGHPELRWVTIPARQAAPNSTLHRTPAAP